MLIIWHKNCSNIFVRGINNTPLHPHHQAKTIKQYIVIIVHLVTALLHQNTEAYTFPTSPTLDIALGWLQAWLGTNCELDGQNLLHYAFLALWNTEWRTSKHVNMPDPTLCFLALFTLQETGGFKAPKDITGDIAKLCKAIQLVMVKRVHDLVDSEKAIHQEAAVKLVQDYIVENKSSTFASLMSLQHYASALAWGTVSPLVSGGLIVLTGKKCSTRDKKSHMTTSLKCSRSWRITWYIYRRKKLCLAQDSMWPMTYSMTRCVILRKVIVSSWMSKTPSSSTLKTWASTSFKHLIFAISLWFTFWAPHHYNGIYPDADSGSWILQSWRVVQWLLLNGRVVHPFAWQSWYQLSWSILG